MIVYTKRFLAYKFDNSWKDRYCTKSTRDGGVLIVVGMKFCTVQEVFYDSEIPNNDVLILNLRLHFHMYHFINTYVPPR